MRSGGVVAVGVCLVVTLGCSDAATDRSGPAAIRRYVSALQAGDFDAAMAERCASAQVPSTDEGSKEQFLAQVRQVQGAAGGELRVHDIVEVQPVRLATAQGVPYEHEFRVRLATATGVSGALAVGTVTENGAAKVCGWSVEESFAVREQLAAETFTANTAHVGDVRGLVEHVATEIDGDIQDSNRLTAQSDFAGVEGWTSGWTTASYGGGRITVVRYDNAEAALGHATAIIDQFAPDATTTFTLSGLPDARVLRYTGLAWTGVQTADIAGQIDVAVAVYDDVVVWMTASGLDPNDDHSKLNAIAEAVRSAIGQ
ncbi:MAG: hypothetical protein Q7V57_16165 [Actinomycetota bacterium]|nr:hypothetical protein [Actinomycetota bacterium]